MLQTNLVFLKLGGSLITDKDRPYTPRPQVIERLAQELAQLCQSRPQTRFVLGHGSGSFGHQPAKKYHTREGVYTPEAWRGFAEVWYAASSLNRLVMQALHQAGLPAIALPASAAVLADDGRLQSWDIQPVTRALAADLVPVVYGDVVFDRQRGGTILSTEVLFAHLAQQLKPAWMLLAGREDGVWQDYPARTHLLKQITPADLPELSHSLQGSASTDVTGGMLAKVRESLQLIQMVPGLQIQIFSAEQPGQIGQALGPDAPGTRLFIDSPPHLN